MLKILTLMLIAMMSGTALSASVYLADSATGKIIKQLPTGSSLSISGGLVRGPGFSTRATGRRIVVADTIQMPDPSAPVPVHVYLADLSNVTHNFEATEAAYDAYVQESKSALHKKADKALIKALKQANFIPNGTTKLTPGTVASARAAILDDELSGPGNAPITGAAAKIERYVRIIKEQGGDPDNAFDHTL